MYSTIGRTGVNVLSPVRPAAGNAAGSSHSPASQSNNTGAEGISTIKFDRSVPDWDDDESRTIERLPFPTHQDNNSTAPAKDDNYMKNEITPSTMHYSQSQDLPALSSFSPSRSSISPRLSPRRSPRNSPLRQQYASSSKDAAIINSSTETWKSRGTLNSDPSEHDYSNSVSRSTSDVQEPLTPNPNGTSSSTPSSTSNNEELLAQLEVLKMQNKMLTTRIQRAQEESHSELEKERKQRLVAVTELTTQNQLLSAQLTESQLQAQRQLQIEKEEFLRLMKQMQAEREQMDQRVRQAEVLAEDEQRLVRMQKAQLQDSLAQLEGERNALARKLEANAALVKELQIKQISLGDSKMSSKHVLSSKGSRSSAGGGGERGGGESVAKVMPFPSVFSFAPCDDQLAGLQKEMSQLASSLQNIDLQKLALGEALQDTENTATINNLQLSQQLRDEKERLELRVQKMCAEQQQMSLRLAQAEESVRLQNELAEQQMLREKAEAEAALAAMSLQQQELIEQVSRSKTPSFSLTGPGSADAAAAATVIGGDTAGSGSGTCVGAPGDGNNAAAAQSEADKQLAAMAAAMEELRVQLQQKEAQALERERALLEQSRQEKEELRRAVQKMKEDLRAERLLQELQEMKDSQIDLNKPRKSSGAHGASSVSSSLAATAMNSNTRLAGLSDEVSEKITSTASSSLTTPVKLPSQSSKRGSPTFHSPEVSTSSSAVGQGGGLSQYSSNNSSKRHLNPPAGSPSASPAHLASRKSLFELLVTDNKAAGHCSSNSTNNNKRKAPSKSPASDARKRDILQFNVRPVQEVQLGVLQYQHESSYHKIHLTHKSMLDVTDTVGIPADGATGSGANGGGGGGGSRGNPAATKLALAGKQKTIMDLDSDSDEEPWHSEPATPFVPNKLKAGADKDVKRSPSKGKGKDKRATGVVNSITKPIQEEPEVDAQVVAKVNPFKSPTRADKPAVSTPVSEMATPPVQSGAARNASAASAVGVDVGDINSDYSNYDMERVAGLPAPHSAAAMNDVPRLKAFARRQLSLLQSLDQAQRQPIFYAAAYGRVEAVQYLLETLPDAGLGVAFGLQWVRGDMHGDTPLHAAASSGCAQCTELLLAALVATPGVQVDVGVQSMADLRNNMRMTPAHLASSGECIDVLYRYKADIEALDCHQRTPLFIACAMNRESSAEYLIECLDHTEYAGQQADKAADHQSAGGRISTAEDRLLRKDRRGDTPLHAAACNGAIECLLLLLQHGIDPRLKNLTGLKAIDLAVRNRHKKCKDILAEYHLHYCTSSEFDSVLFLATLEGHRKIAEQAKRLNPNLSTNPSTDADGAESSPPQEEEYRIIQENPMEVGANKPDKRPSFLNPFATESTNSLAVDLASSTQLAGGGNGNAGFLVPAVGNNTAATAMSETTKALYRATQSMFSLRANKSMRLQRFGAWIAYHDTQSASVFWYNHETAEGQWEEPAQVAALKQQQASNAKKDIFDKTLQAKMSMRLKRIGDWIEYTTESGKTFYYNDRDGSFQWEHPLGPEHTPAANRASSISTTTAKNSRGGVAALEGLHIVDENELQHQQEQEGEGYDYNGFGYAGIASAHDPASGGAGAGGEYTSDSHYPWRAYLDPESGSVFWYNELTHVSQWEMPEEFSAEGDRAHCGNNAASNYTETGRSEQQYRHQNQQQTQPQSSGYSDGGGAKRSRLRSSSFDEHDTHAVAVADHENDLGI